MGQIGNTLEGGTNGTTITTGNSGGASGTAFTDVANQGTTTSIYSTTGASHGSLSALITGDGTTGNIARIGYNTFNATTMAVRFYITFVGSVPATATQICTLRSTSAACVTVNITASGKFNIQDAGGGNLNNSLVTLSANTVYRVEFYVSAISATVGAIQWALYAGDSTTPLDSFNLTNQNLGSANIANVRWGKILGTHTGGLAFDNPTASDTATALIGPYAVSGAVGLANVVTTTVSGVQTGTVGVSTVTTTAVTGTQTGTVGCNATVTTPVSGVQSGTIGAGSITTAPTSGVQVGTIGLQSVLTSPVSGAAPNTGTIGVSIVMSCAVAGVQAGSIGLLSQFVVPITTYLPITPRPNTGITYPTVGGTTARPNTGITSPTNSGITPRPNTGTTIPA